MRILEKNNMKDGMNFFQELKSVNKSSPKFIVILCFFLFVFSTVSLASSETLEVDLVEWSGTQAGVSLTNDVILVGDTYMTSVISIAKNTVVTIDLNGYMLKGAGNGTIIDNKGTLTIKDSRPNSR